MALTTNRVMDYKLRTDPRGDIVELPVLTLQHIYAGGFVGSVGGYALPYAGGVSGTSLSGFYRFVGIALGEVDNSAGASGALTVRVLTSGCFKGYLSGLAVDDVGKPVYASADDTLTKVALGNQFVGWVEHYISSGYGMFRLSGPSDGQLSPLISAMTPAMTCTAAHKAMLIHPSQNFNGLVVLAAFGLVTTQWAGGTEDQAVITLKDTADTTLGITLSGANGGAAAATLMVAALTVLHGTAAAGDAIVIVPAGLGVYAHVTQLCSGAGAAGAAKVGLLAMPVA